jgi:hypothetical protein
MYGEVLRNVDRTELGRADTSLDDPSNEPRAFGGIVAAIFLSACVWGTVSLAIILFR